VPQRSRVRHRPSNSQDLRRPSLLAGPEKEFSAMTIGAALVVVLVGVLIAAFLNSTIGIIVAVIGVVGLVLAVVSGRTSAKL
jgi:Flp pilus assembly protein TadB